MVDGSEYMVPVPPDAAPGQKFLATFPTAPMRVAARRHLGLSRGGGADEGPELEGRVLGGSPLRVRAGKSQPPAKALHSPVGRLEDDEIADVAAYVLSKAKGGW